MLSNIINELFKVGKYMDKMRKSAYYLAKDGTYAVSDAVANKIAEKSKIYGYFITNGHLPPGNKIFR